MEGDKKKKFIIFGSVGGGTALAIIVLFVLGFWHSGKADMAAFKAYTDFNATVQKEASGKFKISKKITDPTVLRVAYDKDSKTFSLLVQKNKPANAPYTEIKKKISDLFKKKKIKAADKSDYDAVIEVMDNFDPESDIDSCKIEGDLKPEELTYDKIFADDFFCWLKGSDSSQMKCMFSVFNDCLKNLTKDDKNVSFAVLAEDKKIDFIEFHKSGTGTSEEVTIKHNSFELKNKDNTAKTFNVLQYSVYALEKIESDGDAINE
ncbi:hypothetical protein EDEG_02757 [Edhazardia aedis USNM 41457]|uniref:Uncharacterized protein n=1 Tax=Edhazardia aedis (strain USNM 41457) TaxID=1003232 RepID=J9DNB5_EDHAE|nr:hypothetical protein EDEG_02757 [Edhazardia aedis USNM 41457]|eukprot:EJW02877.1 hypothetical protein EDEG_02757 [Edhazardia aedis USNM 41457]